MSLKPMILYGEHRWFSPYVFSAFVALMEKGLPFEVRELVLSAGATREPEYRALSLTGRVPSLDHDGFVLSESAAIVEYLDEGFPAPKWPRLLPEEPKARARARQIMGFIRSDLVPLREERSTETMFYVHATRPLGVAARAAADKLIFVTESLLDAGDVPFGSFCVADADLAFMLHRLILNGDALPDRVRAYAEKVFERPSIRAFVEKRRPALTAS
jgi:glutathione S-transferase